MGLTPMAVVELNPVRYTANGMLTFTETVVLAVSYEPGELRGLPRLIQSRTTPTTRCVRVRFRSKANHRESFSSPF
jgi:hypothetical protein